MNLALAMHKRRKALGLSRKAIAKAIKVHPNYIQALENAHRVPSFRVLGKWAKCLGLELEVRPRA